MFLILTSGRLLRIADAVRRGVPARVAASALGINGKTFQKWTETGSKFLIPPPPPANKEKFIEVGPGEHITEGDLWAHEFACYTLVNEVLVAEATKVSDLIETMWAGALGVRNKAGKRVKFNPDMQKFLFKAYGHVHGLSDKAPALPGSGDAAPDADTAEKVQIYVPDNGRGPK